MSINNLGTCRLRNGAVRATASRILECCDLVSQAIDEAGDGGEQDLEGVLSELSAYEDDYHDALEALYRACGYER